jgi:hypothetical protein
VATRATSRGALATVLRVPQLRAGEVALEFQARRVHRDSASRAARRDSNKVLKVPLLLSVPQTEFSSGVRSGFRMWFENICRTAPVPSPFEAAKKVVELKGAGEQAKHLLLHGLILDLKDGAQQQPETEKLARVEEVAPVVVVVAARLVGVVAGAHGQIRKGQVLGLKARLGFGKKRLILRTAQEDRPSRRLSRSAITA